MGTVFQTEFPVEWKDPLDLCGRFVQNLIEEKRDLKEYRDFLVDIVGKYGARWVWENRSRLVALMLFFVSTVG